MRRRVFVMVTSPLAVAACTLLTGADRLGVGPPTEVHDADDADRAEGSATDAAEDVDAGSPLERYEHAVLSDRPMAFWPCEELTGASSVSDRANPPDGGHPLQYDTGLHVSVDGILGSRACSFDGQRELTGDGFAFPGQAPFTLEVWASVDYAALADQAGHLIYWANASGAASSGFDLFTANLSGTKTVEIYRAVTSENMSDPVPFEYPADAGTGYVHIVAKYTGTLVALFLNGQPVGTTPSTLSMLEDPAPLLVGSAPYNAAKMDEIAVYDIDLPVERIRAHFEAGRE